MDHRHFPQLARGSVDRSTMTPMSMSSRRANCCHCRTRAWVIDKCVATRRPVRVGCPWYTHTATPNGPKTTLSLTTDRRPLTSAKLSGAERRFGPFGSKGAKGGTSAIQCKHCIKHCIRCISGARGASIERRPSRVRGREPCQHWACQTAMLPRDMVSATASRWMRPQSDSSGWRRSRKEPGTTKEGPGRDQTCGIPSF